MDRMEGNTPPSQKQTNNHIRGYKNKTNSPEKSHFITHQKVFLTEDLSSNIIEGLPPQFSTWKETQITSLQQYISARDSLKVPYTWKNYFLIEKLDIDLSKVCR